MALAASRAKARYVGAETNTAKLAQGYTSETQPMNRTTDALYRESIRLVLANLSPPVMLQEVPADFVFNADDPLPVSGLPPPAPVNVPTGTAFRFRDTVYNFACVLRGDVDAQYTQYVLAIAQFVVLTFNQLSVDLDDPTIGNKASTRGVCNAALQAAVQRIADPQTDIGAFGEAIDTRAMQGVAADLVAVPPVVATLGILGELNVLSLPQISVAFVPSVASVLNVAREALPLPPPVETVKITIHAPLAIPDEEIIIRLPEADYMDRAVFNANIAAAVLAAKQGSLPGLVQLRALHTVLSNYLEYRAMPIAGGGPNTKQGHTRRPPPQPLRSSHSRARYLGTLNQQVQQRG